MKQTNTRLPSPTILVPWREAGTKVSRSLQIDTPAIYKYPLSGHCVSLRSWLCTDPVALCELLLECHVLPITGNFKKYPGHSCCYAKDKQRQTRVSAEECESECQEWNWCNSFVHSPLTLECWYKEETCSCIETLFQWFLIDSYVRGRCEASSYSKTRSRWWLLAESCYWKMSVTWFLQVCFVCMEFHHGGSWQL